MSRVLLRPPARRDIDRHADYVGEQRLSAGRRFYNVAADTIKMLADSPMMAGVCEFDHPALHDVRVWPIKRFRHYLIFYLPLPDGIDVIRVLHAAQDLEPILAREIDPNAD